MTAPTLERPDHEIQGADHVALVLLWLVPVAGFVAALLGLG